MTDQQPDTGTGTEHGRAWIEDDRPEVLRMVGEVDHPVVQAALAALTDGDLAGVDVVDMAGVTFVDSSAISLVANLLRIRTRGEPLTVDHAPDVAVFILDVAGMSDSLTINPA